MKDLVYRDSVIAILEKNYCEITTRNNYRDVTDDERRFFLSSREDIKKLPSEQTQWIPCSERLPDEETDVLVTRHFLSDSQLKKNSITESYYVEVANRIGDEWCSYSDEYKIRRHLHKVVAWMPLPKPYGGESE